MRSKLESSMVITQWITRIVLMSYIVAILYAYKDTHTFEKGELSMSAPFVQDKKIWLSIVFLGLLGNFSPTHERLAYQMNVR